jgi:hypothetical protein
LKSAIVASAGSRLGWGIATGGGPLPPVDVNEQGLDDAICQDVPSTDDPHQQPEIAICQLQAVRTSALLS